MARAASFAGVAIVTGDTKVVERGSGDGVYVTTTGIGMVTSDFLASRHSSAPVAGSYPRAYWAALVTISVRRAFRQTTGELQDGISSRGVDHTFAPSAKLNAAMNESWLRSHWRMHLPS